MELHFARFSGNSLRAVYGLEEVGAPYRARVVDVVGGENRAAAYLAINPMGKVPSLVDGDLHLWESNAVTWYAAERHPARGLLPASPAGRASLARWLFFQAGHVSPACRPVFMATNPRLQQTWRVTPDPAAAEAGRKELARYLPVLEQALAGGDWLEERFSLAEVAYAPHLWLLAEGGFDFPGAPRVRAWLDRITARPAWRKARALVFGDGAAPTG